MAPRGHYALAAMWQDDGDGERTQDTMIDVMEIHFDEDEGHLRLDCGEEEFSHLRDLVVSGASAADHVVPFVDGIRSIAVRRLAAIRETTPRHFRSGLQIFLVTLILSVSVVVQIIGIIAVARWLLERGP